MAKIVVEDAGLFTLGTSEDVDSLFAGTQLEQVSMRETPNLISAAAIEDGYPDEEETYCQYEFSGTYFPQASGSGGAWDWPSTAVAAFTSADGTVVFTGNVRRVARDETAQSNNFARQTFTYRSTGAPTVAPA
jgi:hypothetical protein